MNKEPQHYTFAYNRYIVHAIYDEMRAIREYHFYRGNRACGIVFVADEERRKIHESESLMPLVWERFLNQWPQADCPYCGRALAE